MILEQHKVSIPNDQAKVVHLASPAFRDFYKIN